MKNRKRIEELEARVRELEVLANHNNGWGW